MTMQLASHSPEEIAEYGIHLPECRTWKETDGNVTHIIEQVMVDGSWVDDCEYLAEKVILDSPLFVRPPNKWRIPVFHLCFEKTYVIQVDYDPDPIVDFNRDGVWYYSYADRQGHSVTEDGTILEQLPEGCEVCQVCAQQVVKDRMRVSQIMAPDRATYNAYTELMMSLVGL